MAASRAAVTAKHLPLPPTHTEPPSHRSSSATSTGSRAWLRPGSDKGSGSDQQFWKQRWYHTSAGAHACPEGRVTPTPGSAPALALQDDLSRLPLPGDPPRTASGSARVPVPRSMGSSARGQALGRPLLPRPVGTGASGTSLVKEQLEFARWDLSGRPELAALGPPRGLSGSFSTNGLPDALRPRERAGARLCASDGFGWDKMHRSAGTFLVLRAPFPAASC